MIDHDDERYPNLMRSLGVGAGAALDDLVRFLRDSGVEVPKYPDVSDVEDIMDDGGVSPS